jgi:hypothetical protein
VRSLTNTRTSPVPASPSTCRAPSFSGTDRTRFDFEFDAGMRHTLVAHRLFGLELLAELPVAVELLQRLGQNANVQPSPRDVTPACPRSYSASPFDIDNVIPLVPVQRPAIAEKLRLRQIGCQLVIARLVGHVRNCQPLGFLEARQTFGSVG